MRWVRHRIRSQRFLMLGPRSVYSRKLTFHCSIWVVAQGGLGASSGNRVLKDLALSYWASWSSVICLFWLLILLSLKEVVSSTRYPSIPYIALQKAPVSPTIKLTHFVQVAMVSLWLVLLRPGLFPPYSLHSSQGLDGRFQLELPASFLPGDPVIRRMQRPQRGKVICPRVSSQ